MLICEELSVLNYLHMGGRGPNWMWKLRKNQWRMKRPLWAFLLLLWVLCSLFLSVLFLFICCLEAVLSSCFSSCLMSNSLVIPHNFVFWWVLFADVNVTCWQGAPPKSPEPIPVDKGEPKEDEVKKLSDAWAATCTIMFFLNLSVMLVILRALHFSIEG